MVLRSRRLEPAQAIVAWDVLEVSWRERLGGKDKSEPIMYNPPHAAKRLGLDAKTVRDSLDALDVPHDVNGQTVGIDLIKQENTEKCPRTISGFPFDYA